LLHPTIAIAVANVSLPPPSFCSQFTARRVAGAPVGPRQQGAAEYQFMPDPSLEPLEYGFSAWVVYNNSADQVFLHTFYNGTIELTEAPTELSAALYVFG